MEEFVNEREFERQREIHQSIFGFVHQMWALAADTIVRGHGHVKQEVEADMSLRSAIAAEGIQFARFLSNRWRVVALTAADVYNGKKNQRLTEPVQEVHIEEEIDDRDNENGPPFLAGETVPIGTAQAPEDGEETNATEEI
jgi:hypothetical protein